MSASGKKLFNSASTSKALAKDCFATINKGWDLSCLEKAANTTFNRAKFRTDLLTQKEVKLLKRNAPRDRNLKSLSAFPLRAGKCLRSTRSEPN